MAGQARRVCIERGAQQQQVKMALYHAHVGDTSSRLQFTICLRLPAFYPFGLESRHYWNSLSYVYLTRLLRLLSWIARHLFPLLSSPHLCAASSSLPSPAPALAFFSHLRAHHICPRRLWPQRQHPHSPFILSFVSLPPFPQTPPVLPSSAPASPRPPPAYRICT